MKSSDDNSAKDKSSESVVSSSVTMSSSQSMGSPMTFKMGEHYTDTSLIQTPDSPEPSIVSLKSDQSMGSPMTFQDGNPSAEPKKDEQSISKLSTQLDLIFKELEEKVIFLVKNEMKRFKELLRPDHEVCTEKDDLDEENSVKKDILKVVQHVLRKMNQTNLANALLSKLFPMHQQNFKSKLQNKFKRINEGIPAQGKSTLLNDIYLELYITEGWGGEFDNKHEVEHIEAASRKQAALETPISCNDIFRSEQDKPIRTVLTRGIAGIGKTVSVQKFILDWCEGKANQDIHFIFPLSFRELNLINKRKLSMTDLLCEYFSEKKELKQIDLQCYKVLFILDGLDEYRLPLEFEKNESLFNITQSSSVDVLLTNLIKGHLFPSALIWITSRPAAANQIPHECVDHMTEVRGFSDPQKDEYFRKRISDQSLANKIITHIKSSRSLYAMCHIPVFSWIAATVLERMLRETESDDIPKTLTQMFTHFLILQMKQSSQKYGDMDLQQIQQHILALGKLAFQQLKKGKVIFYEEDLRESGIDVGKTSVHSAVCTQIFTEETGLYMGKVYCFVHLSVQEHLAAVYVLHCFNKGSITDQEIVDFFGVPNKATMSEYLKSAVQKALESERGHLDLFLRFLMGLSQESNQTLLRGLLTQTEDNPTSIEDITKHIKKNIKKHSPEKSINLFHCLNELNDHSLVAEVQKYLRDGSISLQRERAKLSSAHWSALVFVILNSEQELEEFNLSKYDRTEECLSRLLPVIKASRKSVLCESNLTKKSGTLLSTVLSSESSWLRDLDLSINDLQDSGFKALSSALEVPQCKLEILKIADCGLTEKSCTVLGSVLSTKTSRLRELRLSGNKLGDPGAVQLSAGLKSPHCKLQTLRLNNCGITEKGCTAVLSALVSNPSHIRALNLGRNKPGISGVKMLSELLLNSECKMESLKLFECSIAEEGCISLLSSLISNPSHLKEMDLGWNKPGHAGVKLLCALLEASQCKLEILNLHDCSIAEEGCTALASALKSNPSHLRELDLSWNAPGDAVIKTLSAMVDDERVRLKKLVL